MAKGNLNQNFENLKAEMMRKKEVAKETDVVEEKNSYVSIEEDDDTNRDAAINENKIVIKKAKKVQPPKRITYYLNQETIKKIDKYSKLTGMGKSELVQKLLDIALDNLEIEN